MDPFTVGHFFYMNGGMLSEHWKNMKNQKFPFTHKKLFLATPHLLTSESKNLQKLIFANQLYVLNFIEIKII